MNKNTFIEAVASFADLSQADAARAVEGFMSALIEAMRQGETLALPGFGTWRVKKRAARTGRNPATGKVMQVPETMVPTFKPGAKLKAAAAQAKSLPDPKGKK